MKVIPDFLNELKAIDPRLEIVPNPHRGLNEENRHAISNIKMNGHDVCPIPSEDIYEEPNDTYGYLFPNQVKLSRFKTRPEALDMVNRILNVTKSRDGMDAFMGTGDYADKK